MMYEVSLGKRRVSLCCRDRSGRMEHPVCGAKVASPLFLEAAAIPPVSGAKFPHERTSSKSFHVRSATARRGMLLYVAVHKTNALGKSNILQGHPSLITDPFSVQQPLVLMDSDLPASRTCRSRNGIRLVGPIIGTCSGSMSRCI